MHVHCAVRNNIDENTPVEIRNTVCLLSVYDKVMHLKIYLFRIIDILKYFQARGSVRFCANGKFVLAQM